MSRRMISIFVAVLLLSACTESTVGPDTTGLLGPPVTNLPEATRLEYSAAAHREISDDRPRRACRTHTATPILG